MMKIPAKPPTRRPARRSVSTADVTLQLLRGKHYQDTERTVHVTAMGDQFICCPFAPTIRRAVEECATFDLEDFLVTYQDTRWVEMPR
jgi:hypothetical protein